MIPPTWSTAAFTDITGRRPHSCDPFADPFDYLLVIPGPAGVLCELALIPTDTVISSLEDPQAYEPLERAITITRPGTDLLDRLGQVTACRRDAAYLTLIPGQAPRGDRLDDLVRALADPDPGPQVRSERAGRWQSLVLFSAAVSLGPLAILLTIGVAAAALGAAVVSLADIAVSIARGTSISMVSVVVFLAVVVLAAAGVAVSRAIADRPGGPRGHTRAAREAIVADWARVPVGDARFPIVRRLVATVARTSRTPRPTAGLARVQARAYELAWSLADEAAPTAGAIAAARAEAEALAAAAGL